MRRRRLAFAAALAWAGSAAAQGYDPRYRWRTLDTPHFQLHFHQGEEALAQRFAGAAERAHALLAPLLRYAPPRRTQVVLSDDVDDANGSATPVPYNTVRLYAVPPESLSELNDFADPFYGLAAHEYAHILHLDTVEGVPRLVNRIFGKLWVPNGLEPAWLVEGMAVLHESPPGHGRNSSALFDMYARALSTEGGLPPLSQVSNPPLDWPLGSSFYLLGGRFLDFLGERHGQGALADFSHDQAGWVWPYALGTVSERHFGGKSLAALWGEFDALLGERYRAQLAEVRRRPVTAPLPLTRRDGQDLGRALAVEGNGTLALRSPREAVVAIADVHREYRRTDDLYLVDLESGRRTRITWGERATDPDLSPDGATVVYVARSAPGEMALRRLRLDGGASETLFSSPGAQVYMPRVSPDGRRVAFELQEGGRRDIAVWDAGAVARVTDDDALDTGPAWSPDGRLLLFASDRGGIYNLYAWAPASTPTTASTTTPPPTSTPTSTPPPTSAGTATTTATPTTTSNATAPPRPLLAGTVRQVTNVETGAFEPDVSPDGRSLAFVTYSRAGFDLATVPLDPSSWLDPLPATPRPRRVDYPTAPGYPERAYRPLETLWPTFWLPSWAYDSTGLTLGAFTAGSDVVGLHSWALDARYSLRGRDLDYSAAYLGGWLFPGLLLASQRTLGWAPGDSSQKETIWTPLEAQLAFPSTHLDRSFLVTAGWRGTLYRARPPGPLVFRDGFLSELSLRLTYSDTRRYVKSISREEGRVLSLAVGFAGPAVGSDYSYARAKASLSQYLRVPPARHLALALHLAAGAAIDTLGSAAPFSLGGVPGPDLAGLLLAAAGFGGAGALADELRGYPSGLFSGTRLLSGTLELRFPLFDPQWGHATWPLFLRRLSGAAFLDAGAAYTPSPEVELSLAERLRFAAGGELRFEIVLGYYLTSVLRLGVAQGLGHLLAPSRPDPYTVTQLYLTLGESF
jgi:hypothetical protein